MKARTIATVLPSGSADRRVVERFVEAVAAARAGCREALEVARSRLRIDHGRERGGIGRDDGVLAQAALQAEAGHAEVRILIGELQVARVVGGFRNAPGHAERRRRSSIWRCTISRLVCSSRLPAGARMTSDGIRYSNIDPDHEISAAPCATGVTARPRRNQCRAGTSPLAIARKLASRASEASRS